MVVATLVSVAFGADDSPSPGVLVDWVMRRGDATPTATTLPTMEPVAQASPQPPAADTDTPTDPPPADTPTDAPDLSGFAYPVAGGCLPENDDLMPNAPREYRNGVHEGIDFYDADNCASIGMNTEVLAAKGGTVVRADWAYQDLTSDELLAVEARAAEVGWNHPDVVDVFRGRQVWIDHGDGVVTRYAHLNGIAEDIGVGDQIEQGTLIAFVGESGTPESISDSGSQVHLHFELRVGEGFLGQGLDAATVREIYQRAFSP